MELIKCVENDRDYVFKKYGFKNIDNLYFLNNGDENVGTIEYLVPCEYSIKIEYINILEGCKRKGFATKCIEILRGKHIDHEIYGDSLPTIESISFWSHIGVEFDEDVEEYLQNGNLEDEGCIPFTLN